jgi:glycosyltransferase involved in cell wall biosynthesis
MRFLIVTPCKNAAHLIADTVASVATQTLDTSSKHELRYIVADGASTDDTVAVARAAWTDAPGREFSVISRPDNGVYDALVNALELHEADVVAYLNAGDFYDSRCLEVVAVSMALPGVRWLTGMKVFYTSEGATFGALVPWQYSRRAIRSGYHGARGHGNAVQQESTFWRAELLSQVDLNRLRTLRLAGDAFLWHEFAKQAELYVVAAHLGGFRFHGNHLSAQKEEYITEFLSFADSPHLLSRLRAGTHRFASWIPPTVRIRLRAARRLITWDIEGQHWRLSD